MDPNQLDPLEVPLPPVAREFVYCNHVPDWLSPLAMRLVNGVDGPDRSGISFDQHGNLVFYRKITEGDRHAFTFLEKVDELWITLDMPKV